MQQTCGEIVRNNGRLSIACCESTFTHIEPQSTGSFLFIRPVTSKAFVGKNGADVAIKVNGPSMLLRTQGDGVKR